MALNREANKMSRVHLKKLEKSPAQMGKAGHRTAIAQAPYKAGLY